MAGRILAIGDVHGCHRALMALLAMIVPTQEDSLVFVGDVVDRGPATKQVLDTLVTLHESCQVVLIMGNHEQMMRDALSGRGLYGPWLNAGGRETLASYGGSTNVIPASHIRLLVTAEPFWETANDIFVHASLESNVSLRNQTSDFLRWKHLGGSEKPHCSGKRVICGHTPQKDGIPLILEGWVCIDTYAHGGRWLSGLDVHANHVWQASEAGETRDFPLSKYSGPNGRGVDSPRLNRNDEAASP
ncbi:MAG: metallophosphoesterase family protein [Planctomycetales bacterium]